ncbi:hypothetical protein ACWDF1_07825 [Streptomyces coelicoflavus]|uniref:Uncharacterized protein n=1 Tax=Streptomyces coelicoflavus TaxID=285562 RepID=A0A6N9UZD9_9ACTN|nr:MULTISPECIES: hypothetical protein [Streptomyces]EHN71932.1 hypothetical protein SMCF_8652 [Streptomyces coelicoflavus ZG0656]KPC69934.1 hypothetical protein ADL35_40975 [Streptomyces sp. NRRL WC-3753]MZE42243.1 hypothetical protein [Streptomyces sp. SID5477]NEB21679.1 hypothetical protein [Streptomyces coelicoflavus]OWA14476.1 hypothetical protein B9W64_17645 [Streptomyces sp. CS159]
MTHQDHRYHRNQQDGRDREDPYRLGPARATPAPAPGGGPDAVPRGDVLRMLLWTVVVLSAAANMVLSFTGAAVALHLASGVVTVLAVGALVVRALRGRR